MPKPNYGGAASGAVTGGATGAAFGGVPGALIGGAIGGLGGLFGGGSKPKKRSRFDKTQKGIYADYANAIQSGGGPLGDIYGQFNADEIRNLYEQLYAQPAYQNFQENVVPTITGQFRGQNLQNSSYLGGALSKAGTDVQNNLNAQLSNMLYNAQQAAIDRRSRGVENLLNMNTFDYQKPQASPFESLINGLSSGAGQLIAKKFASPAEAPAIGG